MKHVKRSQGTTQCWDHFAFSEVAQTISPTSANSPVPVRNKRQQSLLARQYQTSVWSTEPYGNKKMAAISAAVGGSFVLWAVIKTKMEKAGRLGKAPGAANWNIWCHKTGWWLCRCNLHKSVPACGEQENEDDQNTKARFLTGAAEGI